MMKKYIMILLVGLTLTEPVEWLDIDTVARNVYNEFNLESDLNNFDLMNIEIIKEKKRNLIYIYHLNPIGFILISADDNSHPVIGYSFKNNFNTQNMPTNINWLFENIKKNILYNIENPNSRTDEIQEEWVKYLGTTSQTRERNVSPLIDAEFDQSGGWNNILTSETGFNGPVGCVAVSMAQIMHYWSYPDQGQGSNGYEEDDLGFLEVDFSQALYDFNNMAATYATNPSRLLLYHSGVAVNMNYESGGSGASVEGVYPSAEYAMQNFFKYSQSIQAVDSDNYDLNDWRNLLKNELDHNKPILYSGFSDSYGNGGHAWNIDGYQGNNMHCNWGWGGYNNGYFSLPYMGGFDTWNNALINLFPEIYENPISLFEFELNNNTATFIDLSSIINDIEIGEWHWDFGDGNTETYTSGSIPIEYTYSNNGEYVVELSVTNIYGQTGYPHTETIIIGNLLPGDINSDEILNVLDIVLLVNFVLGSATPDGSQANASDLNSDGILNVLDIVLLVNDVLGQ